MRPEPDSAEQVPFALAARAGSLAVVGALVRTVAPDLKRTYPDASGFVDYDGYIAIGGTSGATHLVRVISDASSRTD